MRSVIACFLACACVAGCQKGDPSSRAPGKPPELAGTGKPVPDGFVTRFTGPDGLEVELAYTQVWAALHQGKMAMKLSAESIEEPPRSLDIYLDLSNRRPGRVEDLAGAWLTAFPPSVNGAIYTRGGEHPLMRRANSAAVSLTTVTADAVDGTFTADVGNGEVIADGTFRAARSPNLEPDSLAALARRAQ
jgi:hypothetical protein